MTTPLRVLIVEDSPDDAELMVLHLTQEGFRVDWQRVQSEADYLAALAPAPQLILADWSLPQFSGLRALQLLRGRGLEIPFIIVSGSIGEEAAVDALRQGAYDYVLKDRPTRLGPAARRALAEKQLREERRQAALALRESEERYRRLAENAQDLIYRYRLAPMRGFEYVNPAATAITGYTPQEHYADPDLGFKLVHPDDRHLLQATAEGRFDSRQPLILRWMRKDGQMIWTEQRNVPVYDEAGNLVALEGIARDITERKQAEEEIRRRAAQLSALNAIFVAMNQVGPDLETRLGAALEEILRDMGLEMGAIWALGSVQGQYHEARRGLPQGLGAKVILLVREEELTLEQTIAVEDYQAQSSPTARLLLQHGVRAALVAGLWAESQRVGGLAVASAQPRHWSEGEITLVKVLGKQLGALIERARLQAEVEQHSRQLEQIMATVPQGVALLDADLHVLEANPVAREALELLGWPQGAEPVLHLGGRPTTELLAPPPRGRWHELQAQGRTLEFLAHPLAEGLAVMGWVLILVDVTEERETQRRGLQQDRLAAVGRLAAGVAHDFNNILTVILLQATLSLDQPDLPLSLRERLTAISRQTQRASELVRQILDFSRRSMLEQRTMDLVPFLQEQVRILQRVLPETIQVQLTCSQDELLITADPTRIQQVVMNLAVNARDAMPDGGRLHLGLDRVPALPRHLQSDRALTGTGAGKPFVGEEGQWARLTVSDSGTGMASEVLSHLFEPFFTTKEVGQGTGLGLAQVHGIVKQHGGEIEVQTTPGEGTSFIIYLPALPVSRTTDQPSEAQPVPQGQGETILIVEDDASVRQVLVNSVERLQYRVLAAASGQEALALLEQHAEVALVLSDLIMPAMGGKELLRAIRERGLHLPVVLLSGYPLDSDLPDMQALGLAGWLLKPPDGAELARALAQALSPRS